MNITIDQLASLIGVHNAARTVAKTALGSAEPTAQDVARALAYMSDERAERLNVDRIKADPMTEMLGGFEAAWNNEVGILNDADKLVQAVAQIVGA